MTVKHQDTKNVLGRADALFGIFRHWVEATLVGTSAQSGHAQRSMIELRYADSDCADGFYCFGPLCDAWTHFDGDEREFFVWFNGMGEEAICVHCARWLMEHHETQLQDASGLWDTIEHRYRTVVGEAAKAQIGAIR